LSIFQRPIKKKGILYFSFLTAVLSLIFLILSFLSPLFISTDYYQKSLRQLRSQKKAVLTDFASLIAEIQRKKEFIARSSLSREREEIFKLFKELDLKTEIEGIGYYTDGDNLTLWMGNVVDFMATPFPGENRDTLPKEATFIIKDHKASVYLAALQRTSQDDYFVLYRLLAFIPQFKTTYLKEYHFLKPKLLSNLDIQYWDFREDVAGFDRLFSRHEDEYFSQPRPRDEIRSMLFPLRNETDEIVATVTLSPPALLAKISSQKENHLLYFYLFLAASFLSLLIFFIQSPSFYEKRKPLPALLVILILIGLRLIFFSLSNLEKVRSLPVFSPSSASFFSVWSLTKSLADIFLTSFILFLIAGCVVIYSRKIIHIKRKKTALPLSLVINSVSVLASVLFIFLFQEFLFQLVSHSNINLLHFSFNLSFFLLHLSIFFLFCVCLILIFISLRTASIFSPHFLVPVIFLIIGFTGYSLSFKEINFALLFLLQALVLFSILLLAFFSNLLKKKEAIFSAFLIFILFLHTSLYYSSNNRNKSLIQNSLQNIIKYQEHWGNFLLNQSFPEIDKREESIVFFFESGEPSDFAHSLWERTAAAKFNWYSSLEILNPEGEFLSRFALNVPELYSPDFNLPISQNWSISLLRLTAKPPDARRRGPQPDVPDGAAILVQ